MVASITLAEISTPVFELCPVPMLLLEVAGLRLLAANNSAVSLFGHSRDRLLMMKLSDLCPTEEVPRSFGWVDLTVDDPKATWRSLHVDSSGSKFAVDIRVRLVEVDGALCKLATLTDASDIATISTGSSVQSATAAAPARPATGMPTTEPAPFANVLAERDAMLRSAERLTGVHVYRFDMDSGQTDWTDSLLGLYGFDASASPSTVESYYGVVHPHDVEAARANYQRFLAEGSAEFAFDHRIVRPGGRVVHLRAAAEKIEIDGRRMLIGLVLDVSERTEAAAQASRRDYLLSIAGEVGRIGGWRVDLDTQIAEWSPETARIHETPDTRQITVQEGLNYYPTEHRIRLFERFTACAETGEQFDEVTQIITALGNRVWVRAVGAPERDISGRIVAVQGAFQDISDIITLQNRTSELRARLNRALDVMGDAFITFDRSWRVTYLNHRAKVILRRKGESLLGQNIWQLFPEAAGSKFDTELHRSASTGDSVEFEEFFQPLKGWLRITAHPSEEGVAVYFRDVTRERTRSEHLRLLEAAVSRMNDILLITDATQLDAPTGPSIVYANPAFEQLTGYSAKEVIGKTPRLLQGPETDTAELERIRNALKRKKRIQSEVINYGRDGRQYWLEMDISPLKDDSGNVTHFVALQRNTTERKLAEQAVKTNERRFRLMANVTGTALWEWDLVRSRQWWSEGLKDIFGHSADPVDAIPTIWSANVHPEDLARVQSAIESLLSGEIEILLEQYRFRCADGRWAWVEDRAFAIRSDDGAVESVLGSLTDVSSRVDLENRLRRSQKLEAIGQLTGGIAHDFNNLLTIVMGNAELLFESLAKDPGLQEMADQVIGAAQRGADLTNQLLAFARKQTLAADRVDLEDILKSLTPLLSRSLGENVEVLVATDPEVCQIEVDRGQLENALLNLAINARDSMPDGGRLTIETYSTVFDTEAAKSAEVVAGVFAVIAVSDTGCGITKENLDRVLEPFFSTKTHGSGLGLAMVFGFTKQSGGHLKIYSEPGEGTTVRLYFPQAMTDAGAPDANIAQTLVPTGQGELILLVEDDPEVRRNVVAMLCSLSYRVLEADNASSALELLDKNPDVAMMFTDVVMPGGMNGRELAEAAHVRRPELRVLFTSGYAENAIAHQERLDSDVVLLSKPYRRMALAEKLRSVLDKPARND